MILSAVACGASKKSSLQEPFLRIIGFTWQLVGKNKNTWATLHNHHLENHNEKVCKFERSSL